MSIQPINLINGTQLASSVGVLYTSTNILTRIDKLTFTNNDNSAHQVTLYIVPHAGTPGVTNILTITYSVSAGATWNCPDAVGQIIPLNGTLQGYADTGSEVTVNGAGTQISPT